MAELPFLKGTLANINIKKNFAQKEKFASKNLWITNYTKHLPESESSWNQYIWVHIWIKRTKVYTPSVYYDFTFAYFFKKNI